MLMNLTLAAALALSPPAHAITDGQADGPEYVPTYDSAMYDPTGCNGGWQYGCNGGWQYGCNGGWQYGGSLLFEQMFDDMPRGSKGDDEIVWATWPDEDPASDDPGPVALGGDDLPSITAQSEGPFGPLLLTLAQDYRMRATVAHLGALSEQYATPLWFPVEVDGVVVVTVIHGADYAESYAGDSRADWHMQYPF